LRSAREVRKDDAKVLGYSPDSNDVSTEAEESPLLIAVAKHRLVKTLPAGEDLACVGFLSVEISDSVVSACNSESCV
jgi:hypothetical protein